MSEPTADISAAPSADALKIGNAWGDDISEERRTFLDRILASWDAETDHSDRKGPFDGGPGNSWIPLAGAHVFYLAACALIGTTRRGKTSAESVTARDWAAFNPALQEPTPHLVIAYARLRDPDLHNWLDFSKLNLAGAALTEADLSGANLNGVELSAAILHWARLVGADLSGAHLTEANLSNA